MPPCFLKSLLCENKLLSDRAADGGTEILINLLSKRQNLPITNLENLLYGRYYD